MAGFRPSDVSSAGDSSVLGPVLSGIWGYGDGDGWGIWGSFNKKPSVNSHSHGNFYHRWFVHETEPLSMAISRESAGILVIRLFPRVSLVSTCFWDIRWTVATPPWSLCHYVPKTSQNHNFDALPSSPRLNQRQKTPVVGVVVLNSWWRQRVVFFLITNILMISALLEKSHGGKYWKKWRYPHMFEDIYICIYNIVTFCVYTYIYIHTSHI